MQAGAQSRDDIVEVGRVKAVLLEEGLPLGLFGGIADKSVAQTRWYGCRKRCLAPLERRFDRAAQLCRLMPASCIKTSRSK
jgi:hypothetical protein